MSAGPDGSIAIGKGLAIPEGFALGEEDWKALAFMDGFDCDSIWNATSNVRGALYACANGMANGGNVWLFLPRTFASGSSMGAEREAEEAIGKTKYRCIAPRV